MGSASSAELSCTPNVPQQFKKLNLRNLQTCQKVALAETLLRVLLGSLVVGNLNGLIW